MAGWMAGRALSQPPAVLARFHPPLPNHTSQAAAALSAFESCTSKICIPLSRVMNRYSLSSAMGRVMGPAWAGAPSGATGSRACDPGMADIKTLNGRHARAQEFHVYDHTRGGGRSCLLGHDILDDRLRFVFLVLARVTARASRRPGRRTTSRTPAPLHAPGRYPATGCAHSSRCHHLHSSRLLLGRGTHGQGQIPRAARRGRTGAGKGREWMCVVGEESWFVVAGTCSSPRSRSGFPAAERPASRRRRARMLTQT